MSITARQQIEAIRAKQFQGLAIDPENPEDSYLLDEIVKSLEWLLRLLNDGEAS